jgi:hypothetical protein
MQNKSQKWGIPLVAASALTLLWALICPTYTPGGAARLETRYELNGNLVSRNYYMLDCGRFLAGDIVIWSAVFGVYFLFRKEDAQPGVSPNSGPATSSGSSGAVEGPPSVS